MPVTHKPQCSSPWLQTPRDNFRLELAPDLRSIFPLVVSTISLKSRPYVNISAFLWIWVTYSTPTFPTRSCRATTYRFIQYTTSYLTYLKTFSTNRNPMACHAAVTKNQLAIRSEVLKALNNNNNNNIKIFCYMTPCSLIDMTKHFCLHFRGGTAGLHLLLVPWKCMWHIFSKCC